MPCSRALKQVRSKERERIANVDGLDSNSCQLGNHFEKLVTNSWTLVAISGNRFLI